MTSHNLIFGELWAGTKYGAIEHSGALPICCSRQCGLSPRKCLGSTEFTIYRRCVVEGYAIVSYKCTLEMENNSV